MGRVRRGCLYYVTWGIVLGTMAVCAGFGMWGAK